jgi:CubicO group peptidase (beta-lactamase class C family)
MNYLKFLLILLIPSIIGCKDDDDTKDPMPTEAMYFPLSADTTWETKSMASLGWNQDGVQSLKEFLIDKNSKSFMILVNGRIVMEEYFNGHAPDSIWQWNSAGKTLVSVTTGIAEQEGLIDLNKKVSDYIGKGWTTAPEEKEDLITSRHLLSMTSGLSDANLVIPATLKYLGDAGSIWSYSNVFQRLMDVNAAASKQEFETYFNSKVKNKIGMEGFWNNGVIFKIYHSNTRSMARFGLLALNKGKWNNDQIINETYFKTSTTSSQNINPAYGYLWWLNGNASFMVPGGQTVYPGQLVPEAPADMYAAMGAEDQRIYVVPSKNMVIIRMGNASDPANPSFALSGFDNELWKKINAIIK